MLAIARRGRVYPQPHADPNVIPFIDVLLVLLIIFMVTAPSPTTDLRLDLPRAAPPAPVVIPPTVVEIEATPSGYRILLDGRPTALDRLGADVLEHMLAANPSLNAEDAFADGRVYVRSDLEVAYQTVITVIDTLQTARFQKVSIYGQNADEA
jgi:biopolymer transport protein ExbD